MMTSFRPLSGLCSSNDIDSMKHELDGLFPSPFGVM